MLWRVLRILRVEHIMRIAALSERDFGDVRPTRLPSIECRETIKDLFLFSLALNKVCVSENLKNP